MQIAAPKIAMACEDRHLRRKESLVDSYSIPNVLKWTFIVEVNSVFLFVFIAMFLAALRHSGANSAMFTIGDICGVLLVGVCATIFSGILDFAARGFFQSTQNYANQCGQICSCTSVFMLAVSLATYGWAFVRGLREAGQYLPTF